MAQSNAVEDAVAMLFTHAVAPPSGYADSYCALVSPQHSELFANVDTQTQTDDIIDEVSRSVCRPANRQFTQIITPSPLTAVCVNAYGWRSVISNCNISVDNISGAFYDRFYRFTILLFVKGFPLVIFLPGTTSSLS